MRKTRSGFVLKQICLLMSGYLLFVPLTGYASEKAMFVPESKEAVQQVAMSFGQNRDPVAVVIGAAEIIGLNPKLDTFTLISQDASQALVYVTHGGSTFEVRLEAAGDGSWTVSTMNPRF